jgi:NTE family protein
MGKIGLVLGGGGIRGFAHLGAIKALEEKGIKADVFSGTSAGAIVAALLAAEISPDDIMDILKDITITDASKLTLAVNGFATLEKLREKLNKVLDNKDFSDLSHELYICACNLYTGKAEYFNAGNIAKAVEASSSIPGFFSPVEIDGQLYIDGSVLDNVPIKPLIDRCEKIIAIDVMPTKEVSEIKGLSEIFMRIIQISVGMQEDIKDYCDLLIRLEDLSDYNILDSSENEKIFQIGYEYVSRLSTDEIFNGDFKKD